jgi:hypothetical protein
MQNTAGNNFFSLNRLMAVKRVSQNVVPKSFVLDSSQLTQARAAAKPAKTNYGDHGNTNDSFRAKRRMRSAGTVPPKKANAI